MSLGSLEKFCKEASRSFFDEIGLISHQLNSYNQFVSHGLQELFDSLEEITVEPDYDPSKKGPGGWRHAIIKFGKVKLHRPVFWSEKKSRDLDLKPRHARLQNMTYSSQMEVDVNIKVSSFHVLYMLSTFFFSVIYLRSVAQCTLSVGSMLKIYLKLQSAMTCMA
jgi:DNA-directed RNA polymerase beta subunit